MTSVKSLLRTFWFQLLVSSLAKYNLMFIYMLLLLQESKSRLKQGFFGLIAQICMCAESLDFSVRSNKLVVRKTLRLRPHLGNTMGLAASSCTVWQEVVGHGCGIENSANFLYKTVPCRLNPILKCSYNDFKLSRRQWVHNDGHASSLQPCTG